MARCPFSKLRVILCTALSKTQRCSHAFVTVVFRIEETRRCFLVPYQRVLEIFSVSLDKIMRKDTRCKESISTVGCSDAFHLSFHRALRSTGLSHAACGFCLFKTPYGRSHKNNCTDEDGNVGRTSKQLPLKRLIPSCVCINSPDAKIRGT